MELSSYKYLCATVVVICQLASITYPALAQTRSMLMDPAPSEGQTCKDDMDCVIFADPDGFMPCTVSTCNGTNTCVIENFIYHQDMGAANPSPICLGALSVATDSPVDGPISCDQGVTAPRGACDDSKHQTIYFASWDAFGKQCTSYGPKDVGYSFFLTEEPESLGCQSLVHSDISSGTAGYLTADGFVQFQGS